MSDAQKAPEELKKKLTHLLWVYGSALCLLLTSVLCTVILSETSISRLDTAPREISISGGQRMLSQRIVYLASEYHNAPETRATTGVALSRAVDQFEAAIDLFEASHADLLQAAGDVPAARNLYLGPGSNGAASLDERVRAYIANARAVLANPADAERLSALRAIERAGLLSDLDRVVQAFESRSVESLAALRAIWRWSVALAVLLVLFEVLFVLRPGVRLFKNSLDVLRGQHATLAVARDALQRSNDTLKARNGELEAERAALNLALEESNQLREEQSAFTYAVSHDLKSPANTLHMLLDEIALTHDENTPPDTVDLLRHAKSAVSRMSVLVKDTLAYSAATGSKAAPQMVDLRVCVEEVLADLSADIKANGAVVTLGALDPVFGYPAQIRMLVQNLLANAIKFHHPGAEPQVGVSCEKVGLAGKAILQVSDNGIGIAEEYQERIFGLFKRLHLQTEFEGSGLGLATCQRIAANHCGKISVTSRPGCGSTFEVTLQLPQPIPRPRAKELAA